MYAKVTVQDDENQRNVCLTLFKDKIESLFSGACDKMRAEDLTDNLLDLPALTIRYGMDKIVTYVAKK